MSDIRRGDTLCMHKQAIKLQTAQLTLGLGDFLGVCVNPAPLVTFQEEKVRVVFKAVSATDFNECFRLLRKAAKNIFDDAILIALGIDLEPMERGVARSLGRQAVS